MHPIRLMFTVPLVVLLFLALTQPIYYTKGVTKTDIQNLLINSSNLNTLLSEQIDEFTAKPNEANNELLKVLEPLCESQNFVIKNLCLLLESDTGKILTIEILKGLSNYLKSMPDEDQEQMQNYFVDQIYTFMSDSSNNLFRDDKRNILLVIHSLLKSNEILLMMIVCVFCVVMPITKVLYFAFYPLVKTYLRFLDWIPAKFSMLEVFVVGLIILAIQEVPLINVEIGYVAVVSYTLFAITLIVADKIFKNLTD